VIPEITGDLQRDNAREALRLRIYESISQKVNLVSDALGKAKMYVFGIAPAIESLHWQARDGYELHPLNQRVPAFLDLHHKAGIAVAEVLIELESWAIAMPGLEVFQVALNSAMFDVRQAFGELFPRLAHILPMDPREGSPMGNAPIVHPLPSGAALSQLKTLIDNYYNAMLEAECYVEDLKVDAQNNLLSDLFERRVPLRKPLDPKSKVISTEPSAAAELIRYFRTESPIGKEQAASEEAVKAQIEERDRLL
jgi:hypothetical protein